MEKLVLLILISFHAFSTELILDRFDIDLNLDEKMETILLKKNMGLDYLTILSEKNESCVYGIRFVCPRGFERYFK